MKKNILSKNLKLVILSLFLLTSIVNISAYSIFEIYENNQGNFINNHDARSAAMGGTGTAGGFNLMDSNINPANLYYLNNEKEIQFNYSLIKNSENRALPMYNFFDSYVDESTYARNENFYNEFSFSAYKSFIINSSKINLGISYKPILNFYSDYQEEVRNDENSDADNYPPIIAKNFIESDGFLDSYSILLNYGNKYISIGTELSYLNGNYDIERRIHWSDYAHQAVGSGVLTDNISSTSNSLKGFSTKFGISSQINERIRLAVTYSPKITLDADLEVNGNTIESSDDYILASRLRFGMLFKPRNPFETNFQLDMEYIQNSDIDDLYDDTWSFYVGMEHYVGRAIPLRLGFRHEASIQDNSITLPVITAGTGFEITTNLHLDLAGEYGRREYKTLDLFMDSYYNHQNLWSGIEPTDRGWENPDKVTESFFKIFTSLTYKW